jgi:hypothetical protein
MAKEIDYGDFRKNMRSFYNNDHFLVKEQAKIEGNIIIYTMAAWNQVIEQIKSSSIVVKAMLQGFDNS